MAPDAPAGRRLLLVRHGRTAWNAEGRAQGQADVSLDDTGRRQAEEMAPVVAAYDPVLLVSSDLARARETAAYLEKATGLTAEEDPRLREYDLGPRSGLTAAEAAAGGGEASFDTHATLRAEGVETARAVADRIVPATLGALDRLEAGQTGVLVLHGAALRTALAGVLGWPLEAADGLAAVDNCAWAELRDAPHGRLRLAAYNRSARG